MPSSKATSLTDLGKPDGAAAPVETECDPTGTHSLRGESLGSPLPTDDPEFWDNDGDYRSDATGFF